MPAVMRLFEKPVNSIYVKAMGLLRVSNLLNFYNSSCHINSDPHDSLIWINLPTIVFSNLIGHRLGEVKISSLER